MPPTACTASRTPRRIPSYIFRISARDLARFGPLYLHRGRWRGAQVIPASWVDASVRSYSMTGNQSSLGRKPATATCGGFRRTPKHTRSYGISDGSFTASGAGGQRLTVIPQIDTVVVNLMNTDNSLPSFSSNQWDTIVAEVLKARRDRP